jgi:hypothetical protein
MAWNRGGKSLESASLTASEAIFGEPFMALFSKII